MPGPGSLALLILVPLIAWRAVARFRRMVGRQRLSTPRMRITLTLFPLLVLLLAWASHDQPQQLVWLAAGLASGALLSLYGLRTTRFEAIAGQGFFYTPNARLGVALTLLFLARIVYRLVELHVFSVGPASATPLADFARSPVTLAVFGLLAGYYIAYMIGLAAWRMRTLRMKKAR